MPWVQRTSGDLTGGERRNLLRPLARTHAVNVLGRARMALNLHPGRHAHVPPARLTVPDTTLTRAAAEVAERTLPVPLLNHSHRTFLFGQALGEIEGADVDSELLFAAALMHDTGLVSPPRAADFTLASARLARDVAERVGLSTAATDTMLTAITMHHTPGVTRDAGPVAYLLSAGAAIDVVGFRAWELPPDVVVDAVARHPRADFKRVFVDAFRQEAARVPAGRVRFLNRYGAFAAAIRLAPFAE